MESTIWETSVTQLVHDFRDAIVTLAPIMDRQQIRWVDSDVGPPYDDYDELEATLFKVLVVDAIRHALNDWDFKIHSLRFVSNDYTGVSFLSVQHPDYSPNGARLVFNGLETAFASRESIAVHTVGDGLKSTGSIAVPLEGAELSFQLAGAGGSYAAFNDLRVPL